jgi:hypothetical protein
MAKLDDYRQYIQKLLTEYAAQDSDEDGVDTTP